METLSKSTTLALGISVTTLAIAYKLVNSPRKSKHVTDFQEVGVLKGSKPTEEAKFDVIVVGGGAAGCALAGRLSEEPSLRVLLLEAGGSGCALPASRIPAGFGAIMDSPNHCFMHRTVPQVALGGKQNNWNRARLLGGGSSMNAQMAQYGSPEDYDEWARIISDSSWSWKSFKSFFQRMETFKPHPDHPGVDTSIRGTSGPVQVGFHNPIIQNSRAFIQSCVALGITFTHDFFPKALGVNRLMTYISNKYERVSSESAYLTPDVLARPNLKVAIQAQALRVLFETGPSGKPRAVGVEYAQTKQSPIFVSYAKKEVVLSASAVNSPHLLMLSGVGPAEHLKEHDIPVVRDLPGVGSHLQDHPVVDIVLKDKTGSSLRFLRPNSIWDNVRAVMAVLKYKIGQGGPLASNLGDAAAFVRTDDPVLYPPSQHKVLTDSTSGPNSPDLEIFVTSVGYKDTFGREDVSFDMFSIDTIGLHCYLLRPLSSGTVRLLSPDPWQLPAADPRYLTNPDDTEKLLRGFKLLLRIAHTEPLASQLDLQSSISELDHHLYGQPDEVLRREVKRRLETVYHPASTCRMAPLEEDGVVDAQLKVYGVDGLRVCDASIFPWLPSGHTAGPCFAVGEKLADMIKGQYRQGVASQV